MATMRNLFKRLGQIKRLSAGGRTAILLVASLIALIVLGGLLLWGAVAISLSGGWGQWRLDHQAQPDFSSSSFDSRRARTRTEFGQSFSKMVDSSYQQVASSSSDACIKGEHTFAVQDPFAYACSLQQTRYYGFDGDFRQLALDLNASLVTAGWSSSAGIDKTIQDYYDKAYTGPGTNYTAANLPGALYTKDHVTLEITWIERGDSDLTLFENNLNPDASGELYHAATTIDVTKVANTIYQSHRYGISIALSKTYYSR